MNSKQSNNQKVKVSITFEWEFDHKQWCELKSWSETRDEIKNRITFDGIDAFYHLNQISRPAWILKAE
jgi:hypothetical protein